MNQKIKKTDLLNILEPHLANFIDQEDYEIKGLSPVSLLTPNRFDIAFKLFYLRYFQVNYKIAHNLYAQHLNVSTGGTFTEFGNKKKSSLKFFESDFLSIMESMTHGFDKDKSILPVCEHNTLLNGAHRIAAAIFLDKLVYSVNINNIEPIVQDFNFFKRNGVEVKYMDLAALEYCRYAKNIFLAVIWPAAQPNIENFAKKIPNVVYSKDIFFSPTGAINLTALLYNREKWLGDASENYPGASMKVGQCFPNFQGTAKFVLFQSDIREVNKIKDSIRAIANLEKSSIHITDTDDETRLIAESIFNDNSIHFLNNSNQKWLDETITGINSIKEKIKDLDVTPSDMVVDGGAVLQNYGIRRANDFDVICMPDKKPLLEKVTNIDIRSFDSIYHGIDTSDLIYDSSYYFNLIGFKFVSFNQLYLMKKKRSDQKDISDISLMKPYIETKLIFNKFNTKSVILILLNKYKVKIVKFLNSLGIYVYLRPFYKWLVKLFKKQ